MTAHVLHRISLLLLLLGVVLSWPMAANAQGHKQLNWEELPPIPDKEGFAGMFTGVSNGALICMGGANFPAGRPSEGGKKVWYDNIYILEKNASLWRLASEKLPRPLAYGVSATYGDRIIVVGGSDAERHYSDVISVSYENGRIVLDSLVSLPFPLANMAGALVGHHLYIAGGITNPDALPVNTFLALDLSKSMRDQKWLTLQSWPGPCRMLPVAASLQNSFFLFSGINLPGDGQDRVILKDAYRFNPGSNGPATGKWIKLPDMPRGAAAGPTPAPTVGSDHILFPGGLAGRTTKSESPEKFSGFVDDLLAYHVNSESWLQLGNIPSRDTRVTLPTTRWNDQWVIVSGEVAAGIRSPQVFAISRVTGFGWINWATLVGYLALMVYVGVYFNRKDQTTNNFFTASGKIPWWAAGLSIYGTQLSAITFMAMPAIVYATDWSLAIGSALILATVPFVIKYYVPFFRRLSVTSAYEYLEHRFNSNVRILGSISFILFQLGRMGIVLFLPAIAISSVTGIDVYLLIAIMGIICVIYTVMGGIEAVIWADVIQVVILMGGAILCLVIAISQIDGGLPGIFEKGMAEDKFRLYHLGWGYDKLYLWVAVVGLFVLNMIPYTSDQTIVQRYFTVKDEKAAARSLYTNGLITLPGMLVFFGLGTVLYLFYRENPQVIPSENVGEILPYFVVRELPAGVAGLIIAGIFAASQSTLSSSLNSVAAAYSTDIHFRRRSGKSDKNKLHTAKAITATVGLFAVSSAMLIAALDVQFIFDLFQEVLGIFGGSLAGVFVLGIFFNRPNAYGAIAGFLSGVAMVILVKQYTSVHVYLFGAVSVFTCVIVGNIVSLMFPQKKNIEGLTYPTLHKKRDVITN